MSRSRLTALLIVSLALCASPAPAKQRGAKQTAKTEDGEVVLQTPGPKQVLIRGGAFIMGSTIPEINDAQDMCRLEPLTRLCTTSLFADEIAAHDVTLADFWIDRTEVKNRDYRRCVEAGVCSAPTSEGAAAWTARDDHPVTLVTWYDANAYCAWVGARLPTEAEWERAAAGWSGRRYPWGKVWNPKILNHGRMAQDPLDDADGYLELAPVGSFPQGRTPEGLDDMAGNVEEWVADWYAQAYPDAAATNPKGPESGDERVVRGGSFRDGRAWTRTTTRDHDLPSARRAWRGFRCAKSAEKGRAP
jgi:formylglycine-generating enzyme required for sulfatase activity